MTRTTVTERAKLALAVSAVVFCTVTYKVARRVLADIDDDEREALER